MEGRKPLPRDRRLERLAEHPHRDKRVAQVRGREEGVAPRAHSVAPGALAAGRRRGRARSLLAPAERLAAVLRADLERALQRVIDAVVGRLEAEHEQSMLAVSSHRQPRLARVDETAVGRVQSRLA